MRVFIENPNRPRWLVWPLRILVVLILIGALLWTGLQIVRYYTTSHPKPATPQHHTRAQ
jgi:hypothetical protein